MSLRNTVVVGTAAVTTGNNALLATNEPIDTQDFQCGALEVVSTATGGAWILEQSMNRTTWTPVVMVETSVLNPVPIAGNVTPAAGTRSFRFGIDGRWLRLRIATSLTGGNIQARAVFGTQAFDTPLSEVGLVARPVAAGGITPVAYASPLVPAGQSLKTSGGRLMSMKLHNSAAAARFVKVFNVATAPTMGTTAAAFELRLPAGGMVDVESDIGYALGTGIFIAVTAAVGLTNNDATGLAANDVVGFVGIV